MPPTLVEVSYQDCWEVSVQIVVQKNNPEIMQKEWKKGERKPRDANRRVSLQTKEDMTSDSRYPRHRLKHASVSLAARWRIYMNINISSSITCIIFQLPASFSSITRWLPLQRWLPLEGVLREDRLIARFFCFCVHCSREFAPRNASAVGGSTSLPGACSQELWLRLLSLHSTTPGSLLPGMAAPPHCWERGGGFFLFFWLRSIAGSMHPGMAAKC